jgi:hypothetical protein
MSRVLLVVFCLCLMFFLVGTTNAYKIDDVLEVPKAAYPPTIDGVMESIWYSASTEDVDVLDSGDSAPPESYLDLFGTIRVMWDEQYLYVFFHAVDDVIRTDNANTYENDSWEMYFDGDDSKTDQNYDGVDDIQLRIEYSDEDASGIDRGFGNSADWGFSTAGIQFAIEDWFAEAGDAMGWNLEVAFPLEDLKIPADVGTMFGFDVQMNDNDTGNRNNMYRWWGNDNNAWIHADLFGTAELSAYVADDPMQIPQTKEAPVIDAVLDNAWLANSFGIAQGTYVVRDGATVPSGFTEILDWWDLQVEFYTMWDADAFYFFGQVIDDEVSNTGGNSYENDSFELYFDGDNSKNDYGAGVGYDANDKQWRWVYDRTAIEAGWADVGEWAWGSLDIDYDGYAFELKIPASDLTFPLEDGSEIGFEVQVNDRDNETRENMARWWSDDNQSWVNASLFGTAVLTGPIGTAVKGKDATSPTSFALAQNYPNPFNPSTSISYSLAKLGNVNLTVYDLLGNEVAQLVNEVQSAGKHTVQFDGSNLASGVYFYRLNTGSELITKKMMLLK